MKEKELDRLWEAITLLQNEVIELKRKKE